MTATWVSWTARERGRTGTRQEPEYFATARQRGQLAPEALTDLSLTALVPYHIKSTWFFHGGSRNPRQCSVRVRGLHGGGNFDAQTLHVNSGRYSRVLSFVMSPVDGQATVFVPCALSLAACGNRKSFFARPAETLKRYACTVSYDRRVRLSPDGWDNIEPFVIPRSRIVFYN